MTTDWITIGDWPLRILCMLAAMVTIALSEPRLNQMHPCTHPGFRLAFLLLTVGGCWQVLSILTGNVPTWAALLAWAGVAALLVEERHCPRSCKRLNPGPARDRIFSPCVQDKHKRGIQ